jgi:hypothetical protein
MKVLKLAILFAFFSLTIMAQSNQEKVQQSAEMVVAAYNDKDYARIKKSYRFEKGDGF